MILGRPPERIRAFVVGLVRWQRPNDDAPFPAEKRRDARLAAYLLAAGVPEEQLVYLADAVDARGERVAYATLASSLASELSTGNWTFTEGVHAARSGHALAHDDAWVPPDRIREAVRSRYPVGARVEVRWEGEWYPATVRAVELGVHEIRSERYDDGDDEWVATERMRRRS